MDGFSIIILGVLVVGIIMAWGQLTNGTGFVGSRLSPLTLEKLNSGSAGAIVGKIALSAVLGYVIFAILIITGIFKLVLFIIGVSR